MYKTLKTVLITLSFVINIGCSVFGVRSEEAPRYEVVSKEKDFEIRNYNEYLVAVVDVEGNYKEAQNKGFSILADYIFGNNTQKQKVSMTVPVAQEKTLNSEKISMTIPVTQTQENGLWKVAFMMPTSYNLETLPKPNDSRIQFQVVSPKKVATVSFSGIASEKKVKTKTKDLLKWLSASDLYTPQRSPAVAIYNPPWTIPWFRHNEIQIELIDLPNK